MAGICGHVAGPSQSPWPYYQRLWDILQYPNARYRSSGLSFRETAEARGNRRHDRHGSRRNELGLLTHRSVSDVSCYDPVRRNRHSCPFLVPAREARGQVSTVRILAARRRVVQVTWPRAAAAPHDADPRRLSSEDSGSMVEMMIPPRSLKHSTTSGEDACWQQPSCRARYVIVDRVGAATDGRSETRSPPTPRRTGHFAVRDCRRARTKTLMTKKCGLGTWDACHLFVINLFVIRD